MWSDWSLWLLNGSNGFNNSSILVAQVTTVRLVVEQWRLIVVRPVLPDPTVWLQYSILFQSHSQTTDPTVCLQYNILF